MKRVKPTLEALHNPEKYELLASVEHVKIKEFVIEQVMKDKKLVPVYMVYQTSLFLAGLFFFTRAVILAWKGQAIYLWITLATILFCFTLLVIIHELLHGLALKLTGAPTVRYGGDLLKFVFYAEADKFVLGRKPFLFVALIPLIVVQAITIAGIILWFSHPFVYFFLILMTFHSFFCSGDIALATLFIRFPGREVFTYDNREEKTSYYFVEKNV
jgi:hypothetical protein